MTLRLSKSLCIVLLSLWTAATLAAQQVTTPEPRSASIHGTVLDLNGGVVPGASVDLEGVAPGERRTLLSSDDGSFQFTGLAAGTYQVVVHAAGFADWSSRDVVLTPGQFFILTDVCMRFAMVQVTVNAISIDQLAAEQVAAEEKQRVFGIVPNFYVTYDKNPAPLPSRLKFQLAFRELTDPVTVIGFALNAGFYQMAGYPSYSGGAKGYGQRLGATFAGGYTRVVVGDAVLPSLLHQDPRYFYQGTGTTRSRVLHAISSPFITRRDNGSPGINFSAIGGGLASGAIANLYYPESQRGAHLVVRSALIGVGGQIANNLVQEFVLHRHNSKD
jgi:hypothetical protein